MSWEAGAEGLRAFIWGGPWVPPPFFACGFRSIERGGEQNILGDALVYTGRHSRGDLLGPGSSNQTAAAHHECRCECEGGLASPSHRLTVLPDNSARTSLCVGLDSSKTICPGSRQVPAGVPIGPQCTPNLCNY